MKSGIILALLLNKEIFERMKYENNRIYPADPGDNSCRGALVLEYPQKKDHPRSTGKSYREKKQGTL